MVVRIPPKNWLGKLLMAVWRLPNAKTLTVTIRQAAFFVPYVVADTTTGCVAFMKVVNLAKALLIYQQQGVSTAEALNRITDNHLFEVDLAEACKSYKLKKVVSVLDHGDIPAEIPLLGRVGIPYIVFERGDCDAHSLLDDGKRTDFEWHMATLHQVAVGIQELHRAKIAHQDVKRSNVVFFGDQRDSVKLIDLGRAVKRDRPSRNDQRLVPCQPINAPPECLYGFAPADWAEKHFAADLYMLGSLAYSMFFDVSMTLPAARSSTKSCARRHSSAIQDLRDLIATSYLFFNPR